MRFESCQLQECHARPCRGPILPTYRMSASLWVITPAPPVARPKTSTPPAPNKLLTRTVLTAWRAPFFLNRSRTVRPISIWSVLLFKQPRDVLLQCLAHGRRVVRRPETSHRTTRNIIVKLLEYVRTPVAIFSVSAPASSQNKSPRIILRAGILTHALGPKATSMCGSLSVPTRQRHCCDRLGMLCLTNRNSGHTQSLQSFVLASSDFADQTGD